MATIQGVYVALFGRPADPSGLAYFDGITKHGADLAAIGNLAGQAEYLSRFTGMSSAQIVNSIYQSLFNRDVETNGLDYWVGRLANGSLSISDVAIAILDGATGPDSKTANAKVAAADLFTKNLTPEQIAAYNGIAATTEIKAYLATVSADHPGVAGDIANVAVHLVPGSDTTGSPVPASGQFTTGTDTLTTTDGSRVYTASLGTGATLTANDSFHGAGNRLDITDTAASSHDVLPTGLSLAGVSALSLTTAGNAGIDPSMRFDLSGIAGLNSFVLDASGTAGDFVNVGTGIAVSANTASTGFTLVSGAASIDLSDSALTDLTISGNVAGGVTVHDVAATSLNLALNASTLSGFIDANNHISALNITTSAASSIHAISDTALTSITVGNNASLGTDNANLLALGDSVTSVSGASDNASNFISISAANATVTLGNGNNTIALAATATDGVIIVGNGNNTITNNAGNADITVGTGYNAIDLAGHIGSILHLGPDANFSTDPFTPNVLVENAAAGLSIRFNSFSSLAFYALENFSATSAANLIQQLEQVANGRPRTAIAEHYDGNTYIVASSTGVLGDTDTTIVEIVGNHGINVNAGGQIVLIS